MLAPSIQDNDQMSRGCQPSGEAVRIAAMRPENPASDTATCAIVVRKSAIGMDAPLAC